MNELQTQSCCFNLELATVKFCSSQDSLEPDELAVQAVNHVDEVVYMVVKRMDLEKLLAS